MLRDRPHGVGGDAPVQQIPPGPTGAPRVACTAEQPSRTQPGSGQPSPTGARHPNRGRLLAASEARRPRSARQARRPSPPQGWLLTFGKARRPSLTRRARRPSPPQGWLLTFGKARKPSLSCRARRPSPPQEPSPPQGRLTSGKARGPSLNPPGPEARATAWDASHTSYPRPNDGTVAEPHFAQSDRPRDFVPPEGYQPSPEFPQRPRRPIPSLRGWFVLTSRARRPGLGKLNRRVRRPTCSLCVETSSAYPEPRRDNARSSGELLSWDAKALAKAL